MATTPQDRTAGFLDKLGSRGKVFAIMGGHFRSSRVGPGLLALILVAGIVLAYWPALHAGFIWDDDQYVTRNHLLTAPDGLRRIWFSLDAPSQYFPLVYTTFRIERFVWGLNPAGYHWVNLILHIANSLLLWGLLTRLKVPGAWLAAAIFAFHPVQVESVAWITERKNVLMGLFFLLTLLSWVGFLDAEAGRRRIFYLLALVSYVLALSAKTTACTLPAALLLILWLQKQTIDWRRLLQIAPFVMLGLGMGLVAVWWERYHQGTRGALFALGPLERLLVASHAIWFYLGKLLCPAKLTFIYPQWKINVREPAGYIWLVVTAAAGVAVYYARRLVGRSVEVAALFFVATLSPVLGFIMLYTFRFTFVADHYQYLACIGPIALFSAALVRFSNAIGNGQRVLWPVGLGLVALLGVLTWRQSATYRDIETVWRTTIARNPDCWMAYNNLGVALVGTGRSDEAIGQYEKAIRLLPDYAPAHYNLANALLRKGDADKAIVESQKALELVPNDADAHVSLGNALLARKDINQAVAEYERALQLQPDDSDAHYNLGNALLEKGEVDSARAHYRETLKLQPDVMEAHIQLGNISLRENDERGAAAEYEAALKIARQSVVAQNDLAWLLASASDKSLRNGARATKLAEEANRSFVGGNSIVLHTLAAAYAEGGQFQKAVDAAREALRLALEQNDSGLAEELRREIQLYEAGSSYSAP